MLDATLAHLHATPLGRQCVLRGSVLTARWVPGRRVNDLDFLVDGKWTPAKLTPLVQEAFASMAGVTCAVTTIWGRDGVSWRAGDARSVRPSRRPLPKLPKGEGDSVQVGLQLGRAARHAAGRARGARAHLAHGDAEVMFGWKVHSLVEHGPRGRWHPKTMADLALLLRHVKLRSRAGEAAIELSFEDSASLADPARSVLRRSDMGREPRQPQQVEVVREEVTVGDLHARRSDGGGARQGCSHCCGPEPEEVRRRRARAAASRWARTESSADAPGRGGGSGLRVVLWREVTRARHRAGARQAVGR